MGYSQPRRIEELAAREVGLALILLAVAMMQAALLPRADDFALHPLLVLVICRGLLAGPASAARWAFYGGLGLDICADSALGSHALALLAAVLLPTLALARFSRRSWLLPLAGAMLGALGYYMVHGLLLALLVATVDPPSYLLIVMLPGVLLTLIPALPLFLAMRWLEMRQRGEVPVDVY